MMRSLYAGVSGLKTHQTKMDVTGNNIANINTPGFKGSRTTFSDVFSQTQQAASSPTANRGGINPRQIGLGVNVESIDLNFTDASPQQTGKNTDLALSGNGLFYLKSGEQSYYTRNGNFMFDEEGYFVMPGNGLRVQGWNAIDGVLNTNGLATDIVVPVGRTMEATATDQITYAGNLNKESLTIKSIQVTAATGGDLTKVQTLDGTTTTSINVDGVNAMSATITMSDGSTLHVTNGYYEVGKSVPVTTLATIYDSLGGKHQVTLLIDKDSSSVDADANDEAKATAAKDADGNPITDADGNPVYDNRWRVYIAPGVGEKGPADSAFTNSFERSEEKGNPEADGSSMKGQMNNGTVSYLYFSDTGRFVTTGRDELPVIAFEYGDGNGASSDQQSNIDFTSLTQYASNTTSFPTSNGNTSGVLQSIAVDGNGIITGTYTNGLSRAEAQVAIAQFSNTGGLTKVGTTIYQQSNNSGEANIKTVADFGVTVLASALEMSNVDLANEFADMIVTQRGFQANSKMTTVADEMLETLINMKR